MKYLLESDSLQGTGVQGYAEVAEVHEVVDLGACRDEAERLDLVFHEHIEGTNLAHIPQECALKHETIDILSRELTKLASAFGWKVPEIKEGGLVIE